MSLSLGKILFIVKVLLLGNEISGTEEHVFSQRSSERGSLRLPGETRDKGEALAPAIHPWSHAEKDHSGQQEDMIRIHILQPKNDTILFTGTVILDFKTEGFEPAADTPVKVWLPQNGDKPALLEEGNSVSFDARDPSSLLVALEATVNGERVSSTVAFSTILRPWEILSLRAPLPADAAWGISPSLIDEYPLLENTTPVSSELDTPFERMEQDEIRYQGADAGDSRTRGNRESAKQPQGSWSESSKARSQKGSRPLSLVFIGSLVYDGQKAIWMRQMEDLPRDRFLPTFMTFQPEEATESGGLKAEEMRPREWGGIHFNDDFKQRLRDAGVPLLKVAAPQVEGVDGLARPSNSTVPAWGDFRANEEGRPAAASDREAWSFDWVPNDTEPKEAIFSMILNSFAAAEGRPERMTPSWTRDIFMYFSKSIASVAPDILVVGNSKTLGDVVLTRAARWAMGTDGCIVMDFPNIGPALGVAADVLATPSHFAARHPSTKELAHSAGARVVVIPPGAETGGRQSSSPREVESRPPTLSEEPTCRSMCRSISGEARRCEPDCQVVGFVGRLAPEKGPALFLGVARELFALMPSVRFLVVGDGVLKSALVAMAERLNMSR